MQVQLEKQMEMEMEIKMEIKMNAYHFGALHLCDVLQLLPKLQQQQTESGVVLAVVLMLDALLRYEVRRWWEYAS